MAAGGRGRDIIVKYVRNTKGEATNGLSNYCMHLLLLEDLLPEEVVGSNRRRHIITRGEGNTPPDVNHLTCRREKLV